MAYTPKDGSGTLFKNDKGGNEARPDYRGDIRIDGVDYKLSAWIKKGDKGAFMSLSAQPKDNATPQQRARQEPPKRAPADDSDSIPF